MTENIWFVARGRGQGRRVATVGMWNIFGWWKCSISQLSWELHDCVTLLKVFRWTSFKVTYKYITEIIKYFWNYAYFFIYSININICLAVYQNHNRVKTGIWYPSKDCFSQPFFPLGVVTWLRSINSMWMERIFATCLTKRKPLTLGLHSVT